MEIHLLFSGSSGNATRFLSDDLQTDILVDCGESWSKIEGATGEDEFRPEAIIITHEHYDHMKGAGIAGRATGAPLYMLKECYEEKDEGFFKECDINFIEPGDKLEFGSLTFDTFSVRHDSKGTISFKVTDEDTGGKLAFITDTGVITKLTKEKVKDCNALCIEMDYDTEKLANFEEYDPLLKQRISSQWGHLSNQQSLEFIKEQYDIDELEFITAIHLSERTNSPDLVLEQMIEQLGEDYKDKYYCAPLEDKLTL